MSRNDRQARAVDARNDSLTPAALPTSSRDRVHKLWDELADYGAAHSEQALMHALQGLGDLVRAQQAYWLCTVRMGGPKDIFHGWRSAAIRYLHPGETAARRLADYRKFIESGMIDPAGLGFLQGAGRFRVVFLHELVEPAWYESQFYRTLYEPYGIQDIAFMVTPVGADVESCIGLHRMGPGKARFGPAERALLEYAGRAMKWFHRPIVLHNGLLFADEPLAPTERRVLAALLAGGSESAIAAELKLAVSTVHTYATRIFRKFNVKGRAGLTALWLHHTLRQGKGSRRQRAPTTPQAGVVPSL